MTELRPLRAMVVASPLSQTGGVATYWRRILAELPSDRVDVEMVTGLREFDERQWPKFKLNIHLLRWARKELIPYILDSDPGVVATSISQSDIVIGFAGKGILRQPWVVFVHGQPYPVSKQTGTLKRVIWRFLWRLAVRRADLFIVVSEAAAKFVPAGRRVLLVPPVTLQPASPPSTQASAVGYVGRMSAEKDPGLFGEIARASRGQRHFLAYGDGELLESVRSDYPEVVWKGNRPTEEAFGSIDTLLLPSKSEGLGMVLLEAAAFGVVPIAADVGGVKETIHPDNRRVLLIDAERREQPEQWLARVEMLSDPSLRMRVLERQHEWVAQQFGTKAAIERLVEALESI